MQWWDIENKKRDIFFSTASRPRAAEGSTRIGMEHKTRCALYTKWPAHMDYLFTTHRQAHLIASVFPTIKRNSRKPKKYCIPSNTGTAKAKREVNGPSATQAGISPIYSKEMYEEQDAGMLRK
jgi:hypothetical protein